MIRARLLPRRSPVESSHRRCPRQGYSVPGSASKSDCWDTGITGWGGKRKKSASHPRLNVRERGDGTEEERVSKKQGEVKEIVGMSVNADTAWQKDLECRLAGVMKEFITRVLGRQDETETEHSTVDVAPGRVAAFVYCLGNLIVLDLRLQFGWR